MSPMIPLVSAGLAALLLYRRAKRLSARPPRSHWGDPRRRAIAEAFASAVTVLVVGYAVSSTLAPTPPYAPALFALLALGTAASQFHKSLRAPRALITIRR